MSNKFTKSMFYPLTLCALQIVFMIMIMIIMIILTYLLTSVADELRKKPLDFGVNPFHVTLGLR